jgi:hypothetical protein
MWSKSAKVVAGTTLHRLTFLALASRVRDAAAELGQASRNAPEGMLRRNGAIERTCQRRLISLGTV